MSLFSERCSRKPLLACSPLSSVIFIPCASYFSTVLGRLSKKTVAQRVKTRIRSNDMGYPLSCGPPPVRWAFLGYDSENGAHELHWPAQPTTVCTGDENNAAGGVALFLL